MHQPAPISTQVPMPIECLLLPISLSQFVRQQYARTTPQHPSSLPRCYLTHMTARYERVTDPQEVQMFATLVQQAVEAMTATTTSKDASPAPQRTARYPKRKRAEIKYNYEDQEEELSEPEEDYLPTKVRNLGRRTTSALLPVLTLHSDNAYVLANHYPSTRSSLFCPSRQN